MKPKKLPTALKPKKLPTALCQNVENFLESISEAQANAGCNDWDFTKAEKEAAEKFLGRKIWHNDGDILAIVRVALGFKDDDVGPDEDDALPGLG